MSRRFPSAPFLPAFVALALSPVAFSGCGTGDGIATCGGDRSIGAPVASASADGCLIVDGDLLVQATTASDLSSLEGLQRVSGSLIILDNHLLEDLTGLESLTHVGGDLLVRGNPQLEPTQVDALVERLQTSGGLEGTPVVSFATDPVEDEEDEEGDEEDLLDGETLEDDEEDEEPVDDPADDEDPEAPEPPADDEDPAEDDEPGEDDPEDPGEEDPGEEDPSDEDPGEEDPDDFEPEDPGVDDDVDCDGDAACALDLVIERLENVLLMLESTVDATRFAVDLVAAGEDATAEIEAARALGELTGDAIGDLFGALFQAFLSGVDIELLWLAVEDSLDASDSLLEALDELELALDDAFGISSASGACDDAADDLEDAEQTLQVLQGV